ncbi:MAG: hypothetical protein QXW57_00190 [Candidatus Micrarchaeaceae archaeon]
METEKVSGAEGLDKYGLTVSDINGILQRAGITEDIKIIRIGSPTIELLGNSLDYLSLEVKVASIASGSEYPLKIYLRMVNSYVEKFFGDIANYIAKIGEDKFKYYSRMPLNKSGYDPKDIEEIASILKRNTNPETRDLLSVKFSRLTTPDNERIMTVEVFTNFISQKYFDIIIFYAAMVEHLFAYADDTLTLLSMNTASVNAVASSTAKKIKQIIESLKRRDEEPPGYL